MEPQRNCVCCNHSVRRRRYHQLLDAFLKSHPGTREHIQGLLAPQQLLLNGEQYICRNCWLRVQYAVNRNRHQDGENGPLPRVGRPTEGFFETTEYTRSPNTSNTCIFHECGSDSKCRIPESIKLDLLVYSNYYVPTSARVCREHLEQNKWHDLIGAPNATNQFTGEMFVDMTKTLQTAVRNHPNIVNFEDLRSIDPVIDQIKVENV